jgi:hypothetical protein
VIDNTNTDCIPPLQNEDVGNWIWESASTGESTGWISRPEYSTVSSSLPLVFDAIDQNNDAQYSLEFVPPVAGEYSMIVQGSIPGELTGVYWENDRFQGSPANVQYEPNPINFNWGSRVLVTYTSEKVSARFVGYLRIDTDGEFEIACFADAYCDVWIDNVRYLNTIGPRTTNCANGCSAGVIKFEKSRLYAIRVDYVTLVGNSFLSLKWRVSTGPFAPIPHSNYIRPGYLVGNPYVVNVKSGRLRGKYSDMFLAEPDRVLGTVGKPFNVYIHVKDETNSFCTWDDSGADVVVKLVPASVNVNIGGSPSFLAKYIGGPKCIYSVSVIPVSSGWYELHAFVNGEEVNNSPIRQQVTGADSLIDPANCEFDSLQSPSSFTTQTSYTVTFILRNVAGLDIEQYDWTGIQVRGRLERSKTSTTTSPCSSRNDYSWTINCFPDATDGSYLFSYVDDILLDGSEVNFAQLDSFNVYSMESKTYLEASFTTTVFAGPHSLYVWIGDGLLTGSPVELLVGPSVSASVSPTMSLVQIPPGMTQNYFEDADITARVLLRDVYGNPLPSKSSETVNMIISPQMSSITSVFPCRYVTEKYYECVGWTSTPGINVLTMTVNGQSPSVMTGGPPEIDGCYSASTCGAIECPCMQSRKTFSVIFNALTSP